METSHPLFSTKKHTSTRSGATVKATMIIVLCIGILGLLQYVFFGADNFELLPHSNEFNEFHVPFSGKAE